MVGGGVSGCCLTARRCESSGPHSGDVTPNFERYGEAEEGLGWFIAAMARRGSSIMDKFSRRRWGEVGVAGIVGLSGVVGVAHRLGVCGCSKSDSMQDSGMMGLRGVGR